MQLALLYGHNGPQAGDEHVADLLKRSVEGQWTAMMSLESAASKFSLISYGAPLATNTIWYHHKMALLRWQLASAYLDTMVVELRESEVFPDDAYTFGDTLCDVARHATRNAVQSLSLWQNQGEVPMAQAEQIGITIASRYYKATWSMYRVIVSLMAQELRVLTHEAVPSRFRSFFETEVRRVRTNLDAFQTLHDAWYVSKMEANRKEVLEEAAPIVKTIFNVLQGLWAPYLYGGEYMSLLEQAPSLEDVAIADPWVITDPRMRALHESNDESRKQLAKFWTKVVNPEGVMRQVEQVKAQLATRRLRRRTDEEYRVVPWPSEFIVRYPVTIDGVVLNAGDLAAFYDEEDEEGRITVTFRRVGKLTRWQDFLA